MIKLMLQFIQVAKTQNLSQAANHLCLSQPTLSHHMHKLEDKLNTKLFNRTSKGIKLTESGELLYEQAKMLERLYKNTLNKLEESKLRHQAKLKIGCGDAWWHLFIRDYVEEFRQSFPRSNITIDVGDHLYLMNLLLSGDISLSIGHEILGFTKYEDVLFYPLFSSNDAVFVRKGHPLQELTCSDEDLARFPSVDLTTPKKRFSHLRQEIPEVSSFEKRHYLQEKVIYKTNSFLTAIDLLQNSDAILPYPAGMKDYFVSFDLVTLKLQKCFSQATIGAYIHKDKTQDKQTLELLAQFRKIIESKPYLY